MNPVNGSKTGIPSVLGESFRGASNRDLEQIITTSSLSGSVTLLEPENQKANNAQLQVLHENSKSVQKDGSSQGKLAQLDGRFEQIQVNQKASKYIFNLFRIYAVAAIGISAATGFMPGVIVGVVALGVNEVAKYLTQSHLAKERAAVIKEAQELTEQIRSSKVEEETPPPTYEEMMKSYANFDGPPSTEINKDMLSPYVNFDMPVLNDEAGEPEDLNASELQDHAEGYNIDEYEDVFESPLDPEGIYIEDDMLGNNQQKPLPSADLDSLIAQIRGDLLGFPSDDKKIPGVDGFQDDELSGRACNPHNIGDRLLFTLCGVEEPHPQRQRR